MAEMNYGPPGMTGVKTLQYLSGSADGVPEVPTFTNTVVAQVAVGAAGLWLGSHIAGSKIVRTGSLLVALGAVGVLWSRGVRP